MNDQMAPSGVWIPTILIGLMFAASQPPAFAQSQALNGQIEGTVLDQHRAAVPNVVITATNIETGATRTGVTDGTGSFRFPLLPLGNYKLAAEANSFKRTVQYGVKLSTGQTAVVNLTLYIGDVREIIAVSADAPVADTAKIELGRVMNNREVQNLPLITLNPYNFVFLQSNVTGNRAAIPGLGFPNINANGFSRRGNYQIDGNYATDVMLGGVRMLFLARPYIQEIQLTTNGMNAEFGATVGHVMNVVTPSGSNEMNGGASYQFRRSGFAAQRFNVPPGAANHQPIADVATASFGGPIIKDRWHYYAGFEAFKWDLASASRMITITPENKAALVAAGVPASAMPDAYPAPEAYQFLIARTDVQLNSSNRLGIRFFLNKGRSEKIGVGAAANNTLQLTVDNELFQSSLAAQLISNTGARIFNELRFQRSARSISSRPNEHAGAGDITIRVTGVGSFGAPSSTFTREDGSLSSVQNNVSLLTGNHSLKIGVGFSDHEGRQESQPNAQYRFPSLQHYLDAANGANRRSYGLYTDTFGDPATQTAALYWNVFAQDDWRVNRRLKINAGLRYDLFLLPEADPGAAYPPSLKFKVDKNNFGPRLGLVYAMSEGKRPAVIRASAGIYYDPPILNYYVRALQGNGNPRSFSFSLAPLNGPEFPGRFQGQVLPDANIEAVDPNFKTMSAVLANLQFEKALTEDLSFTVAYSHSSGRHIATGREVNCQPTGETLADGRPLYGDVVVSPNGAVTVIPCTRRVRSEFQNIWVWESVGNLTYDAATFMLARRLSSGYQFTFSYTLARSRDDAAEENVAAAAQWQSDPSNRKVDRAVSVGNQTHTIAATFVGRPNFNIANRILNYILNNNQFGVIVRGSDGERQNLVANIDLNRNDGRLMDRPVGIPRNYLKTPLFFSMDIRYSRNFGLSERHRLELFVDVVNLTNTNSIVSYTNRTLAANNVFTSLVSPLTGELRGPLPDFRALGVTSTDSRRMQLGLKFHF